MTNPTFKVSARGREIEFTSAFATLALAYHALAANPDRSEFANDLMVRARARQMSETQKAWMHKLATDAATPSGHRNIAPGLNLSKIIEIFDTAFANEKKFPRIVLAEAFDDDRTEVLVKIVRCGSRSQYEGAANIKTADDEWAGRINRDGTVLRAGKGKFAEVENILRELAADPLQVLKQNGIATSQCCYCGRALNDPRSREVGYGPICADKYGLPYGSRNRVDAESDEAKVIVREVS